MLGPVRKTYGAISNGVGAAAATASAAVGDILGSRGDDPLAGRDPDHVRATLPALRTLTDIYFRPQVRGLEYIPDSGPVLLVGNHSGGTLIADTFAFTFAFYTHFGPERRFFQLAHDLAVNTPGLGGMLRRYGTLGASHENAERALGADAAVLVYPGGDYESYRPSWHSDRIEFGGRSGFIKLALNADCPIVPIVAIGGQETALFLTRGQRVARTFALDRLARLKVFPIQLAPPFGLTVLDLPLRTPLPAQITVQVRPPIDLRERFGDDPDVGTIYDAITGEMQETLDELAAERDLPLIGKLGRRPSRSVRSARAAASDGRPHADGDRRAETEDPEEPDEPWPGYDDMNVSEIEQRLRDRDDRRLAETVRRYERAHKARKGVLSAAARELARA